MTKTSKEQPAPEGDPKRGDQILRRMLKTKPKPHKEMVKRGRAAEKGKQR